MAVLVQKYGGSSVADADRVRRVAARVAASRREGLGLVVVVSALGDSTDALLDLARAVAGSGDIPAREMDMLLATGEQVSIALLAMALDRLGVPAISLTGRQAGIHTDGRHRNASIVRVDTRRIERELARGRVVVVAGFQGHNRGETTTLGRGGSDLTAVALAAALHADRCEIYSDVEGVYTADPRVVPEARKLSAIAYEEMLELAALGAQVLQRRSVEYAQRHGVVIEARSTFSDRPGTLVGGGTLLARTRQSPITGLALSRTVSRIAVRDIPDRPGIAAALFSDLAREHIDVDMIIQTAGHDGRTVIAFTVSDDDSARAAELTRRRAEALGGRLEGPPVPRAKVSAVGMGIRGEPGVASTMFRALADENINIEAIATSEIRISCLVPRETAERAMQALHRAFHLERSLEEAVVSDSDAPAR